ncbi:BCS1 N terminal-domain-containing protein [Podospora fimiseda]|uniref:BCS1 N terminal-domain-containing protein n=1 Tax=Podospora fimiseda TaxID=252190 RepID=A0AAN7H2W9_9PEZI|nr:BCS1 N terminal-domain-containing protein [Podospora fimiseda]
MEASISPSPSATGTAESHLLSSSNSSTALPNSSILDLLFPGFSILFTIVDKYVGLDLNFYMPLLIFLGSLIVAWRYFSEYFQAQIEAHLMSVVDIRTDDEIYNMLMAWVAEQKFSQGARRFVANTNLNSRAMWWTWWRELDEEDEEEDEMGEDGLPTTKKKKKALSYTPTFGSHWFFYRGRILIFRRQLPQNQWRGGPPSEKEEIQIQCFGRSPWILKELINEARENYIKKDEHKTLIYRGGIRGQNSEPSWQRCMSRNTRPFSTVILNEKVKKDLIDDVTDYLNPATRRWYANRGIPYRRGYLLYGPPGTGKSSLSLALAGFFKMRIYIVSLSSITANEENLASLFNDLPRRCVVLLEDIDTAGLTHTRENVPNDTGAAAAPAPAAGGGGGAPVTGNLPIGRLSLSGLLNILDGVASQEGRVLIMTTNHIEKLDKALIRPGRVDMVVKFDRADPGMTAAIFRAIYAPLEEDASPNNNPKSAALAKLDSKLSPPAPLDPEQEAKAAQEKQKILDKVDKLAKEFASKIPDKEFSPAEIQGFLLKNKRDPQRAVDGADEWIVEARKEKKEKEKKEEEEKKKEEEEGKKKEDEEKKVREELEKKLRQEFEMRARMDAEMKALRRKNRREDVTDSDESESESERKQQEEKRRARKARKAARALHAAEADVTKQKKEELGEVAQAVVVVDAPAGIKVDTKKANQAAAAEELKGVKTAPDSGYGTPGVPGTP